MSSTPILFRIVNPLMKAALKSPIHPLVSANIMIITFSGRKSGKRYSTPVSYFQENGAVYCFTHGKWWRNLEGGAKVELRIRGKDYQGHAEAISAHDDLKSECLSKMLKAIPGDARFYGVSFDERGEPNVDEVRRAVVDAVMIKTSLED
jgi:deazaflavin-dependent oxidoreductase (nitroreductase family)